MRIFLVRHGQSEANVDKLILKEKPDHTIGLSELGRVQAEAAGRFLGTSMYPHLQGDRVRVWHSPYARARQTAEIMFPFIQGSLYVMRADMREHILIGEQQFGLFDGVPDEELPVRFPEEHAHYDKHERHEGRFWARLPMGESRFDVAQRVHQAFGTFHRDADRHGIDNIVIVCHGVVIRAFVMMWCHKSVEWFEKEPNPWNGSIRLIEDGEDRGYIHREDAKK